MWVQTHDFTSEQLERFEVLQRQVYATLQEVADTLEPGVTEQAVAQRIHRDLRKRGARSYFHVPVALFGERSAYPGEFGAFEALPTQRVLHEQDAVILDAAPVFDGFTIDCSYAVPRSGADGGVFAAADALLSRCRALILERAEQRANMRAVAREVDAMIVAAGFENCHKKHLGNVLAHRITRSAAGWLGSRRVWGLSPLPVGYFLVNSLRSRRQRAELTPNWNHTRQSDCAMQPGLWAVEPHVARGVTGVKFEEMLVVTHERAYYLDDDLPHHRRWSGSKA
ncbi:MAG: M24 family metallopeptidase [Myxococcota bacterium]